MIQTEGLFRPIRGVSVVVAGAGPAHALYFSCYESLKEALITKTRLHSYQPFAHGLSGCISTLIHDGIMTPTEGLSLFKIFLKKTHVFNNNNNEPNFK